MAGCRVHARFSRVTVRSDGRVTDKGGSYAGPLRKAAIQCHKQTGIARFALRLKDQRRARVCIWRVKVNKHLLPRQAGVRECIRKATKGKKLYSYSVDVLWGGIGFLEGYGSDQVELHIPQWVGQGMRSQRTARRYGVRTVGGERTRRAASKPSKYDDFVMDASTQAARYHHIPQWVGQGIRSQRTARSYGVRTVGDERARRAAKKHSKYDDFVM